MQDLLKEFSLGVIEGFFGEPWSWRARVGYAPFLHEHGFRFYIYAPKADEFLRKRWREDWPAAERKALEELRAQYCSAGVAFGIGFTPYGIQSRYTQEDRIQLERKMSWIESLEPDLLAVLFDDVPGIVPDLAARQAEITADAVGASRAASYLMCPTYYADDPVFAETMGPAPPRYLEELGERLDGAIQVFWTGPRICSAEYTEAHLREVTQRLGRKPFLWDNYPVNDGPAMAKHLHLRPVTGRPHRLASWSAGLAANPMNQAELSKIPLLTLAASFERGEAYRPAQAFSEAARAVCGEPLAAALEADLALLHEGGLDALDADRRRALAGRYAGLAGPAAEEVVRWLEGGYAPSAEVLAEFVGYI